MVAVKLKVQYDKKQLGQEMLNGARRETENGAYKPRNSRSYAKVQALRWTTWAVCYICLLTACAAIYISVYSAQPRFLTALGNWSGV